MAHGFDDYRIFISAPGDLEPDRDACYAAVARANEETAMPAKVLLISVGLREDAQILSSRAIASENVRWSSFFIQVFQDDWGPRDLFRKLFLLAVECRDDAALPMRDAVVAIKDVPNETNAEILAFRKELDERTDLRIIRYKTVDELREQMIEVCNGWARAVIEAAAAKA